MNIYHQRNYHYVSPLDYSTAHSYLFRSSLGSTFDEQQWSSSDDDIYGRTSKPVQNTSFVGSQNLAAMQSVANGTMVQYPRSQLSSSAPTFVPRLFLANKSNTATSQTTSAAIIYPLIAYNGVKKTNSESDETSHPSSTSCSPTSSIEGYKDKRKLPVPPKHNVMYHPSRYKTEICRQYTELGHCEYADRCLFAHGLFELRPLPNRHPKHKTEKCTAFHETGFCTFGPRCSFIHSKVDAEEVLLSLQEKMAKNRVPMPENPNNQQINPVARCQSLNIYGKENSVDELVDELVDKVPLETIFKHFNGKRLPVFQQICKKESEEKTHEIHIN
ncbi:Zinc finger protein 36: C3H1 type-like 1 [Dinothrombium tinctorium]|uniref:Zinc finger protein 36: C3H1 type-like 1 n=1 Tax=Dinothrombium tinctorium TaxID=1965070 RepID=A0A3S3P1R1_9ACAR|nr:Zinc finger protein 36: C3H1 type-like 1 [Dinothrombium tinctorium]RWS09198.1 Zinc finger protein 36: C3H1 type-like 1 [Dinothrombium tinctorium]RWS12907.1 Zinc finger protein 36: C3H1 type-like 1 [Dinothrombium tinctorium]